jgi:hypothetical protein
MTAFPSFCHRTTSKPFDVQHWLQIGQYLFRRLNMVKNERKTYTFIYVNTLINEQLQQSKINLVVEYKKGLNKE